MTIVTAYAIYLHDQNKQHAISNFYALQEKDLHILQLEAKLEKMPDIETENEIKKLKNERNNYLNLYNDYTGNLEEYDINDVDQIILKMARIFGECELNMPDEFVDTVKLYINKWKSTKRFVNGIQRAIANNYLPFILHNLTKRNLPPQFIYLPLQESDFIKDRIGPETHMGHAKGMWQFIKTTAVDYGLELGPLKDTNVYDAYDDRFDFCRATRAATTYLKEIYKTDAQASGLLVMASYNWGEHRVINAISKLIPSEKNEERNFWKLITAYGNKVPWETHQYVFYIFSAAVIGENPKLFNIDLENPIKFAIENPNSNNLNNCSEPMDSQ